MTISGITSATGTTATTPTDKTQLQANSNDFLKLFMAQLQQQDPLNPQSGSDMVAQLAQLSAVEQSTQTNNELQALAAAQGSAANANMAGLVGRNCDANIGDFSVSATGGTPPPIQVSASSSMSGASLLITDANGKEVRRIALPSGTSGTVQWDGKDASGNALPPGSYHAAIDNGTNPAAITAQWHGSVGSVELTADGTRLRMGDVLLDPASIATIGSDTSTSTSTTGAHP